MTEYKNQWIDEEVYYASKDRMGECLDNLKYKIKSKNFIGVIGSFSFLNYLSIQKFKNITLFDINKNQVDACSYLLEIIKKSKSRKEFLENILCRKLPEKINYKNQTKI